MNANHQENGHVNSLAIVNYGNLNFDYSEVFSFLESDGFYEKTQTILIGAKEKFLQFKPLFKYLFLAGTSAEKKITFNFDKGQFLFQVSPESMNEFVQLIKSIEKILLWELDFHQKLQNQIKINAKFRAEIVKFKPSNTL